MSKKAEVKGYLKWVPTGIEGEQTVAELSDTGSLFGSPP